jgi:hypothetical protein
MHDRTKGGLGPEPIARNAVRFASNGSDCAAWHYPGTQPAAVRNEGDGHRAPRT